MKPESSKAVGGQGPSPLTPEQVKDLFLAEKINRPRVGLLYRFWILVGAVTMVLLPLVYTALMVLVGFATYYHAMNHYTWMITTSEKQMVLGAVGYTLLLMSGLLLFVFMIKPIFSRRHHVGVPRVLNREEEPALFALVDEVARRVRSPKARRIVVDLEVNAAASMAGRGPLKLLVRSLDLRIGLPLAAGLSQREFTGIIAHELGHFSQGLGMRLFYIIRMTSGWFYAQVHERDGFDEWLERNASEQGPPFVFVFVLAQFWVWMVRKILQGLFLTGLAVTSFLSRQMERDADRYELEIAGSESFVRACRRLRLLGVAQQGAMSNLGHAAMEERLADNLPALVFRHFNALPDDVITKVDEAGMKTKTGFFDTHPADSERIRVAADLQSEGIMAAEEPATALFADYEQLARSMTLELYRDHFGKKFKEEWVAESERIYTDTERLGEAFKAQKRYFQALISPQVTLGVRELILRKPENPRKSGEALMAARAEVEKMIPLIRLHRERHDRAVADIQRSTGAMAVLDLGATLEPGAFDIDNPSKGKVNTLFRNSNIAARESREALEPFLKLSEKRLMAALELLYLPMVQEKMKGTRKSPEEAQQLLNHFLRAGWGMDFIKSLLDESILIAVTFQLYHSNPENPAVARKITGQFAGCQEKLKHLRNCFESDPYPFEHTKGDISLSEYLIPEMPHPMDYQGIFHATQEVPERFFIMYYKLLGELALIGEDVEAAFGMKPLEVVEEEGRAGVSPAE